MVVDLSSFEVLKFDRDETLTEQLDDYKQIVYNSTYDSIVCE